MANNLGLSCPRGGDWYICQDTKIEFVGCCTSDPCADGSGHCPPNRLRPASFSSSKYSKIPALECDDSDPRENYPMPQWYTCAVINPPFLGCCYSNPCGAGQCPDVNLTAARLTSEPTSRQSFLEEAGAVSSSKSNKLSGGAIAGIVIGVIVFLAAIAGAFWFLRRRKQQKTAENLQQPEGIQDSEYKTSPYPNHSPHPSQASPHSGYTFPGTPPQVHGFQKGYHQTGPSELGSPYVAELSANHAGEVAMLDSTPIQHHDAHSPTIPPSATTTQSGWPADKK